MSIIIVILPFFSREKSSLIETIRAVLGQQGVPTPHIILVDDGSPFPATEELATLGKPERAAIRIIRQSNQGAPAARNTGLDAMPRDGKWIAMLDADDIWAPDHLVTALRALEKGYDFYFADFKRMLDPCTHFVSARFDPSAHPLLPGEDELHCFSGDFFTRCIRSAPVGLSSVVVRRAVFDSFRFPIVPWTFEDLGFFLDAAHRTTRVVFSSKVKVTYGVGAIAAAQGWKSNLQLRRELCYSQHFHNVVRRYPLTDAQKNLVQAALNTHIDGFAATFLALCRNGIMPDLAITREFVKLNPRVVSNAASLLAARLLRGKGAQTESHSNR